MQLDIAHSSPSVSDILVEIVLGYFTGQGTLLSEFDICHRLGRDLEDVGPLLKEIEGRGALSIFTPPLCRQKWFFLPHDESVRRLIALWQV